MKITKLAPLALLLIAVTGWPAAAQTWDTSGNGLLNGTYYFREVFYILGDTTGDLSRAISLYGQIQFTGSGTYTLSSTNCEVADSGAGSLLTCAQWLQQTGGTMGGTYSISASGYGSLSNPLSPTDTVYGLVSQQGVLVGSSTESGFNDLFIAAPVSSQTTAATFKGSYTIADMDLSSGSPLTTISAMFQVNPDGVSNLGNISVNGYVGEGGSSVVTQSLSRVPYNVSSSAFNLAIPNVSTGLISGQKFMYISPDGNFVFGGSPTAWDFWVGVRAGTGTPNFSGLYYQAGIDEPVDSNGYGYLDSYYGSLNDVGGPIVGHERIGESGSGAYDYTYSDTASPGSTGAYSDTYTRYAVGAGGTVRIGSGIGPYLGLNVALAAPSLSGTGVFLNPQGVVNAASSAPFTASIVPGEFIDLYGSGLAPSGLPIASLPFPTQIGQVQVLINGVAAPIYYASPTFIEAIVPYEVSTAVATIQVINNGTPSNTVTNYVGMTAPGIFTQSQNGLGYGAIQHSADYSLVTASHPAQPGETVFVYLSGLGAVSPTVGDGVAASSTTLSYTTNTITADVAGETATVSFAGLVPTLSGLYQVNVVVPTDAIAGDNTIGVGGPDSDSEEALIPVGTATATASARP